MNCASLQRNWLNYCLLTCSVCGPRPLLKLFTKDIVIHFLLSFSIFWNLNLFSCVSIRWGSSPSHSQTSGQILRQRHFWLPSQGQVEDDFLDCGFKWCFIQFHSKSALWIVSATFFCKLKSRVSSWILRQHLWKICCMWLVCHCTVIMLQTELQLHSSLLPESRPTLTLLQVPTSDVTQTGQQFSEPGREQTLGQCPPILHDSSLEQWCKEWRMRKKIVILWF